MGSWPSLLLRQFGLAEEKLQRVAYFLLGHTLLDRWLIHAVALARFRRDLPPVSSIGSGAEWEARLEELIANASARTFHQHLVQAQQLGMVGPDVFKICEEVNRARDHFLHWEPGRFTIPKYDGLGVTTEEGLRRCMVDIDRAISAIAGGKDRE